MGRKHSDIEDLLSSCGNASTLRSSEHGVSVLERFSVDIEKTIFFRLDSRNLCVWNQC